VNLQVHCEHCDRSLYHAIREATPVSMPEGLVVLYDKVIYETRFGSEGQMEFCGWSCVAKWAIEKVRSGGGEKGEGVSE